MAKMMGRRGRSSRQDVGDRHLIAEVLYLGMPGARLFRLGDRWAALHRGALAGVRRFRGGGSRGGIPHGKITEGTTLGAFLDVELAVRTLHGSRSTAYCANEANRSSKQFLGEVPSPSSRKYLLALVDRMTRQFAGTPAR